MPKDIGKKLKECRISSKMSVKDISDLLTQKGYKASESTIYSWENGNSQPTPGALLTMCKAYGVEDVLSTFGYEGYKDDGSLILNIKEQDMIEKYRSLDAYGQDTVSYILDREVSRVQQISNAYKDGRSTTHFPTYYMAYYHSLASAGNGEYIFEDLPTDTIEVPLNELSHRADFVIGVNGDSMEPTYYDGEKVYVEKMQVLEIGDIGIFMINNECFIKEVGEDGLISHNPKYDIISGSENIECIGKVLGKVELSDPAKIQTLSSEGVRARNIGKTLLGNKNHKHKQK